MRSPHRCLLVGIDTFAEEERAVAAAFVGEEDVTVVHQEQLCMVAADILTGNIDIG